MIKKIISGFNCFEIVKFTEYFDIIKKDLYAAFQNQKCLT